MAEMDNPDLESSQIYYNWAVPLPPVAPVTNITGDGSTVVININGASGPSITISGGSTGYEFNTSGSTISLAVDNAATVRSSISAAKSGVNTDITELNGASQVDVSARYEVAGTQVVQAQGAAVPDATGAGDVVAQLNTLLARLRAHGLIAT